MFNLEKKNERKQRDHDYKLCKDRNQNTKEKEFGDTRLKRIDQYGVWKFMEYLR